MRRGLPVTIALGPERILLGGDLEPKPGATTVRRPGTFDTDQFLNLREGAPRATPAPPYY
jgi:hypothetical protein